MVGGILIARAVKAQETITNGMDEALTILSSWHLVMVTKEGSAYVLCKLQQHLLYFRLGSKKGCVAVYTFVFFVIVFLNLGEDNKCSSVSRRISNLKVHMPQRLIAPG